MIFTIILALLKTVRVVWGMNTLRKGAVYG